MAVPDRAELAAARAELAAAGPVGLATGAAPATAVAGRREKLVAVFAAFLGLFGGYPSIYGGTTTVFVLPLTSAFGWGRTVPSLMFVFASLGVIVASLYLGQLIERHGAHRVAAVSALASCAVLLGFGAQGGSIAVALSLAFLIGCLGAGTGVGLYLSLLPTWFEANLGKALGAAVLGHSLGMAVMPAVTSAIVGSHGWRHAYQALSAIQFVLTACCVALLAWLARRARVLKPVAVRSAGGGLTLQQAMRMPWFWWTAVMVFLSTAGVMGASVHLLPQYGDKQVARQLLPLALAALGLGTLLGRVGCGVMLDRIEGRFVAGTTFLLAATGILWLALLPMQPQGVQVIVPPLLIGVALGAESDMLAYLVRRYCGLAYFPTVYNRLLIAFFAGAICGPVLIGVTFDRRGDSFLALAVLTATSIAAALISLRLPSTRQPQQQPAALSS